MLIHRKDQIFLVLMKTYVHHRNRINLNGRRSDWNNKTEKGKIIFLPLRMWLLTHEKGLCFTSKHLYCILKTLVP